jgi:hypothetical protein
MLKDTVADLHIRIGVSSIYTRASTYFCTFQVCIFRNPDVIITSMLLLATYNIQSTYIIKILDFFLSPILSTLDIPSETLDPLRGAYKD